MNYRHAYHAGNFADVLKHAVLALVIEYLKKKSAPFRVIDTHAGPGRYDLTGDEARKTGEWQNGIARLFDAYGATSDSTPAVKDVCAPTDAPDNTATSNTRCDSSAAGILAPYLDAVRSNNAADELTSYPGSPWLARHLIRATDKLIVNELHTDDYKSLRKLFSQDKQTSVLNLDGWTILKSVLPPPERRGVILIDPPFEEPGELERLSGGLSAAVKRFSTGTYILWYPIKERARVQQMHDAISDLGLQKLMRVELSIRTGHDETSLNGCGLIVLNPPYTLENNLRVLLPELARLLAVDPPGNYRLDWLSK